MSLEMYAQLQRSCIEKAQVAEAAADRRHAQLRENAKRQLMHRYPAKFARLTPSEQTAQIRDMALELQKTDAVWKGHVARNQWYTQYAIMYGIAANGELLRQILNTTYRP